MLGSLQELIDPTEGEHFLRGTLEEGETFVDLVFQRFEGRKILKMRMRLFNFLPELLDRIVIR